MITTKNLLYQEKEFLPQESWIKIREHKTFPWNMSEERAMKFTTTHEVKIVISLVFRIEGLKDQVVH